MDLRDYYDQFRQQQKKKGLRDALRTSFRYARNNPMSVLRGTDYQTHRRVDVEHRWDLIQDCVEPNDSNILDIGCAEGVLTSRFADAGLFAIGIDKSIMRLSSAQRKNRLNEGVGFMQYEINPDTIQQLPEFDIVLLLTVYHHWCRDYGFGWDAAEEMLQTLVDKSGKLVFECPEKPIQKPEFDTDRPVRDQYEAYFDDILGNANVGYLDRVDYMGDDRNDLMFLIQ